MALSLIGAKLSARQLSTVIDLNVTQGGAVNLPALKSVAGSLTIESDSSPQSIPALTSVAGSLKLINVSSLALSSLQSVGVPGSTTPCGTSPWSANFYLDASSIATLELPALTSACLLLGNPGNPCTSGNLLLTKITAPNLTQGGVQFFNDPMFPKCRADALAAQIPNPIPYQGSAVFEHCPLASGPCP
jgi:hypothetical protein